MSAGQAGTVKFLLHHHANPNLKDHRDEAPLHAAVRTGNLEVVEVFQILIDFNQVFNRPFYRYGGQIEFTRFKEYYGMPSGHSLSLIGLFGRKENFTVCISGKRRSLIHPNTAQRSFLPITIFFLGELKEKLAWKTRVNTERVYRIVFMPPGHPIIVLQTLINSIWPPYR